MPGGEPVFPMFALCHNGTGVLQFIPSLTNDSVYIYLMIYKLHVDGNPGLAERQILNISLILSSRSLLLSKSIRSLQS